MAAWLESRLDALQGRYRPTGILATVEDPQVGLRIMLVNVLAPPLLTLVSILGCLAFGEVGVALVLVGFLGCQLVSGAIFLSSGDAKVAVLIQLCGLLVASTLCHYLLGGYLSSGGSLLFGIAVAAGGALFVDRRTAYLLMAICLGIAFVMVPLEPLIREQREPPALGLSLFVMVTLYVTITLLIVPPAVATVARLRTEQARNRALMLNILPGSVAEELKDSPGVVAAQHPACSIVFADLVGFTEHARDLPAVQVVEQLNVVFTRFDSLAESYGAEKIKTIGDGYMAVCGLPEADPDHVANACRLALSIRAAMPDLNEALATTFGVRIGVHTGPVVAGVIGTSKFAYDVWGDTVNVASRLEATTTPGAIAVSTAVVRAAGESFAFERAGLRRLKGHGSLEVFHLIDRVTTTGDRPSVSS